MRTSRVDEHGQLLFIGLEEDRWNSSLEKRLQAIRPSGVLLTQQNLRSPEATAELLGRITKALDVPPFLAIEDAAVGATPLLKFFPALPSLHVVATKGPLPAERLGNLAGAGLHLLGFNTTFAPLLDLVTESHETREENMVFGADAKLVANSADAFVRGLQHHGVLACPKYFPGFGAVKTDPDSGLELSGKPMARIWSEDLVPYRTLLPRVQLVLVGHRAYKAYDLNHEIPASLSANILEGLLRVKLGYSGVALANFSSYLEHMSVEAELILKSIAAGCDMVMAGPGGSTIEFVVESLRTAFDTGTIRAQRADAAMNRIARAKKGMRLPSGKFSKKAFDRLCREFEDFNKECRSAEREIV